MDNLFSAPFQLTTQQLAKELSETTKKAKLLDMELKRAKEQISSLSGKYLIKNQ